MEPVDLFNYEELQFDIIGETWNVYELEDGTTIRTRAILLKILWPKEQIAGEQTLEVNATFHTVIVTYAPASIKGQPNQKPLKPEEAIKLTSEEVRIINSKEEWNIYQLPDDKGKIKIKTKMVVTSIRKIPNQYGEDGAPYYLVGSSMVIGPA